MASEYEELKARLDRTEAKLAHLQEHFWSFLKDRRDHFHQAAYTLSAELREMRDEGLSDHLPTPAEITGIWAEQELRDDCSD